MKVLVSGASLAGPSLAYWLTRAGHDVTVVERADLVTLLYDASKDDADYRFENSIATLEQDGGGVDVTFARGAPERPVLRLGEPGPHADVIPRPRDARG